MKNIFKLISNFNIIFNNFLLTDFPIDIINPDPNVIILADIDGIQKRISTNQTKQNTITLTQDLDHDIWQLEAQLNNPSYPGYGCLI